MDEVRIEDVDFTGLFRPGDLVAWGQAGAEPMTLTRALMAARHGIGGVRAFVGIGLSDTASLAHADAVSFLSYCGAGTNRQLAKAGRLDIVPVHYSTLPRALDVDVLLIQVAEDRATGRLSLGIAHEYLVPMLRSARTVIAEINARAPWTHSDTTIDPALITLAVRSSIDPLELSAPAGGAVEQAIARHIAGLVEDGSTLQLGIGQLPETILRALADRRDLGIHSGAIGDGVADLTQAGVITNAAKSIDTGATIAGVMLGTRRIYDFAHRNPAIQFRSSDYTHDVSIMARHDRFVAINSAIEVDLTGQINAEVAGGRYVGAVGGGVEFLRGAALSRGGLPIIALPSTAANGAISRIVNTLSGPTTTARSDAGIIVTEHGVADLRGRTLAQRRALMLSIADPAHHDGIDA